MVETIMVEDALEIKDCVFIDVRTPKEFEEYHIKDAINVPLFSNSERHEIGCLYKQVSQEKAIQFGMDMFLSRVDSYLKEIKGIKKDLIVYCWRGGMRSRAIAELFNTKGYRVWQLDGGIKAYRNYILKKLNEFNYDFEFYVLCGLTGSGKTKVLKNFENSLDLEDLAQHRGSLFGGVGLKRRSQKMFDVLLFSELEGLKGFNRVLIEGESRKIGDLILPEKLFTKIRRGKKIFLEVNLDERAKNIREEYFVGSQILEIKNILLNMKQILSINVVNDLVNKVDEGDYFYVSKKLLEKYYDSKYRYTMKDFKFDFFVKNLEEIKLIF